MLLNLCNFFFYIFLGSITLCYTFGCFKSSDTQVCVTMDGDEVFYADFKNGSLIWDSKIPTAIHASCAYSQALYSQYQCRYFVHDDWKQHETIMNTKGNWFPINIYTTSCYNISLFFQHIWTWNKEYFTHSTTGNHHLPQRWNYERRRQFPHLLNQKVLSPFYQNKVDQKWYRS